MGTVTTAVGLVLGRARKAVFSLGTNRPASYLEFLSKVDDGLCTGNYGEETTTSSGIRKVVPVSLSWKRKARKERELLFASHGRTG